MLPILVFFFKKSNRNDTFTAYDSVGSRIDLPLKCLPIEFLLRLQINFNARLSDYERKLWITLRHNIFKSKG
jgi:hypothetical protein